MSESIVESSLERQRNPYVGWVVYICLCVVAYNALTLYKAIRGSDQGGVGKSIAVIQRSAEKVSRKRSDRMVWNGVNESQSLFKKDSIRTGAGSAVSIRLNDGTVVELGENSLVVLDDQSNVALGFIQGQAVIRSDKGDQKITTDKSGKTKVEKIPLRLLSPELGADYFIATNAAKDLVFAWKLNEAVANLTLDVSQSPNFNANSTQSFAVPAGSSQLKVSLTPGHYHWRLSRAGQSLGDKRHFDVQSAVALKPTAPANGETLKSWMDNTSVTLRWSNEAIPEGRDITHNLQVASDSAFKQLIRDEKISAESGTAVLTGLVPGTYHWRLLSHYGEIQAQSAARSFSFTAIKNVEITPVSPLAGAAIEKPNDLRFAWQTNVVAELNYTVDLELAHEGDWKALPKLSTKGNTVLWKNPGAGFYRWKLSARNRGDAVVGQSAWQEFSLFSGKPIQLTSPSDKKKLQYWQDIPTFNFAWSPASLSGLVGAKYEHLLTNDPTFKTGIHSHLSEAAQISSAGVDLKPGTYYWKVRVVDAKKVVYQSSPVFRFEISLYPQLEAPKLASTTPDTVNLMRVPKGPQLAWVPVKDAKAYEITVREVDDRSPASLGKGKVVFQKVMTETRFLPGELKDGKYQWAVRAIDRADRPGELLAKNLTVTYGAPLASPKVTSPEVQ